MIKNYKGYLLALLIISGIFIAAAPFAVKYWVGNYSGAEVTASEATAIAAWGDAADGVTSTQADKLFELSSTGVLLQELNRLDLSTAPVPMFEYMEDFIGTVLDSAGGVNAGLAEDAQISTNATLQGWKTFGTAGWTLTQAASTTAGVLTITAAASSNNEFSMQLGELATETFIEYTASSGLESWVEFRVSPTSVTTAAGFFIGLAAETAAVTGFINNDGIDLGDFSLMGFMQYEADPDAICFIYGTAGGAIPVIDTLQAIVAGTYYSLGIYFDGATTITYYINGTSAGTVATTATGLPDTIELSPIVSIKQGAGARVLNVDYIKMVGERATDPD